MGQIYLKCVPSGRGGIIIFYEDLALEEFLKKSWVYKRNNFYLQHEFNKTKRPVFLICELSIEKSLSHTWPLDLHTGTNVLSLAWQSAYIVPSIITSWYFLVWESDATSSCAKWGTRQHLFQNFVWGWLIEQFWPVEKKYIYIIKVRRVLDKKLLWGGIFLNKKKKTSALSHS